MKHLLAVALLSCLCVGNVWAKAPYNPTKVVSVELIVAGLEEKLEFLGTILANPAQFDEQQEYVVRAGGVIACLAQALNEHEERGTVKIAGPALRDAALELQEQDDHAECLKLVQTMQSALKGESSGEHAQEHPWDELISMYDMMEEMNERNGGLSRSLRRPRGKIDEQLNASTNAVLSIAMLADHSYLDDDSQTKQWDDWSKQCLESMNSLVQAIKAQDKDKVAEAYQSANRACDQCHEQHRAE